MTEQDPLDTMDIQHIRLTDGQEIIAYINSVDGAMIITERPMLINSIQNNGYDTYFFIKYMPFAEINIVKINSKNVIAASTVRNDIKERYIQAAIKQDIDHEEEDLEPDLTDDEMDLNFMDSPSKKYH